jgi:hypothetical protein
LKASKRERFYFISLAGDKLRFRNVLRKKGEELEPMIQMEVKIEGKWLDAIRCDRGPHPSLHVHFIDKGRKNVRRDLVSKDAVNAITEVIDLIKRDWQRLFKELHYEEITRYFASDENGIKRELDSARDYLLEEAKRSDLIIDERGKGVKQFDANSILTK